MLRPALRPPMRAPMRSANAPSEGVGGRTTALRIGTFGDSTANVSSLARTDISLLDDLFGAGLTQITRQQEKSVVSALYRQAYFVANGGVTGETTTQALARSSSGPSASRKAKEDVSALTPNVVFSRSGINDLTALSSPITQGNIDDLVTRKKQIVDYFADLGIWVFEEGVYGYSGGTNTAEVRAALVAVNAAMAAYSRSFYRFIDFSGITHDGTGAYASGISIDGTHLSLKGGYLVAKQEATALRTVFGSPTGFRHSGTNLIPNADLAATGSQAYGTVGTNWTINVGNGTRANAQIETINGVVMQTVEITPTADNASGQILAPFPIIGGSPTIPVVAGEVYGFECDIFVDGLAAAVKTAGASFCRMELFTGTPRNLYGPMEAQYTDAIGEAFNGHVVWEPVEMPDSSINLTSNCRFLLNVNGGLSGDRTPFKLGMGNPRMVRLS